MQTDLRHLMRHAGLLPKHWATAMFFLKRGMKARVLILVQQARFLNCWLFTYQSEKINMEALKRFDIFQKEYLLFALGVAKSIFGGSKPAV